MITFDENDSGYISWIRNNRNGFVINYTPVGYEERLVLHRARCPTIRGRNRITRTANGHIKVCSNDREELVKQANESFGHKALLCEICRP